MSQDTHPSNLDPFFVAVAPAVGNLAGTALEVDLAGNHRTAVDRTIVEGTAVGRIGADLRLDSSLELTLCVVCMYVGR